jgi:RimK family alpha-L-glutamate ligase
VSLVRIAVLGSFSNAGTCRLVERWRALGLDANLVPASSASRLRTGDVAIGRLDVRQSLDGIEPGLLELFLLERRGIDVRNGAGALLAAHDKLRTATLLRAACIPHPRTWHLGADDAFRLSPPLVLKPRFGSWGTDVRRCTTLNEVRDYLRETRSKPWFARHGVLVQEEIPSCGRDLRVLVAAGRVIGAVERRSAPGEWRTNISCGGSSEPTTVPDLAGELAATAAAAIDADLVGVDLLPVGPDRWVVVEVNGAIDFDESYSFPSTDVYAAAAEALGLTEGVASAERTRLHRASVRDRPDRERHENRI